MSFYKSINKEHSMHEWRNEATEYLNDIGIKVFNPAKFFSTNCNYNSSNLVPQNKLYARECQMAICNMDYLEESGGSVWELGAFSIQDKPIIAFGKTKWQDVAHIRDSMSIHFDTIQEVLEFIETTYVQ